MTAQQCQEERSPLARIGPKPNKSLSTNHLSDLTRLASVAIETSLVANLSKDLHSIFDPVCNDALPIYFGPLLGRLYLEGL